MKIGIEYSFQEVLSLKHEILCGEEKFYDSAYDAARQLNIDNSAIRKCCNGKLKSYKGYLWLDVNEEAE